MLGTTICVGSDQAVTWAYLNADFAVVAVMLFQHVLLQHLHGWLGMPPLRVTDGTGVGCDVLRWYEAALKLSNKMLVS